MFCARMTAMNANPLNLASTLLLAGMSFALADETPVQPQIESAGLFKNGVAVVKASFTVPGPGTYDGTPSPRRSTAPFPSIARPY